MRAGGRSYYRRRREFRAALTPQEPRDLDYDCVGRMQAIDSLSRPWRDLINEHGFVPVVKCLQETRDIRVATRLLLERWHNRQQQLANGSF